MNEEEKGGYEEGGGDYGRGVKGRRGVGDEEEGWGMKKRGRW